MNLEAAVAAWRRVVGAEHVSDDAERRKAVETATFATRNRVPVIVRPATREEVQECLRAALRCNVPVYPVSRGCNWGFGSRVPPADGCAVFDLARLDRIRGFDEALAYVTVEPGVTPARLRAFLEERGSRLRLPGISSSAQASLIGNALERGAGAGPGGYRVDNVCNLEVVLPDGSLLANAAEFDLAAAVSRYLSGPGVDALFFQSNLGIVTAMTFWLQSVGSHPQVCYFAAQQQGNLADLVDGLRQLLMQGVMRPCFSLSNDYRNMAARQQYPWDALNEQVPLSHSLLERMNRTFGAASWWGARWTGFAWLQGSSSAHARVLRDLISEQLPGAERLVFVDDDEAHVVRWDGPSPHERICAGFSGVRPSRDFGATPLIAGARDAYWRKRRSPPADPDPDRDRCGAIFCVPQVPLAGKYVLEVCTLAESIILEHGFEPCINVVVVSERCAYVAMQVFFDREVPGEDERALSCRSAVWEALSALGYPAHRTDILDMNRVAALNPARALFASKLKSALDPENLLAPRRYQLG